MSSAATLHGSTYPSNQQTSYYFQYGTTSSYGTQTPLTVAGSGTQTINLKASITGLTPYTTYHYRLVAVNAAGTAEGKDRTFTTKKIPLTFTISPAPRRIVFGGALAVSGTLTGTDSANHPLVLLENPFPFLGGFKPFGSGESTNAVGFFSFPVERLSQTAQFRVATLENPPVESSVVLARVAVRVTLHVRPAARPGFVRLYGIVAPAQALALLHFQLLRPGRSPATVSSFVLTGPATGISHFSRAVRIRRAGLYRAYVQITSGAQVSNHSRPVLIG